MMRLLLIVLALLMATPALALEPPTGHGGEVRVPLEDYERMLALLNTKPRPAPATYAIGRSSVAVEVAETDRHTTASVAVTFRVETFEDEWTLIPLLPPGAALHALTMGATGSMVLAVTTRVALAHTGRPLKASRLTVISYCIFQLAIMARVLAPLLPLDYLTLLDSAALGWMVSFALFVWVYWPVLTGPREDSADV